MILILKYFSASFAPLKYVVKLTGEFLPQKRLYLSGRLNSFCYFGAEKFLSSADGP